MVGEQHHGRDPWPGAAGLLSRLARAWWLGVIAFLVGLGGTAVWVFATRRTYRSEAVVIYERPVVGSVGGLSLEGGSPRQVGVQLRDMVTSRQRLEKLIKEMDLYPQIVSQRSVVDAADEMRSHIQVAVREGYAYRVSYDANSRELAQQVLTRLLQSVLDDDTKRRTREAEQAKVFLDKERQHADDVLKEKEALLAAFLDKHPQLALETGTNVSPGGSIRAADRGRGTDQSGAVAYLELQAAQIEMQLTEAMKEPATTVGGEPADPLLIATRTTASQELQTAERQLQEKQARFTDEHPDVKLAQWQVAQARTKLRAAEAALTASRPAGAKQAARAGGGEESPRAQALRRALAAVRSQIGSLRTRGSERTEVKPGGQSMVAVDTEWTRLARAVTEARERQEQLEAKQFQAQLLVTLVTDNQAGGLSITDPPFRPVRPVSGARVKIALVGTGGSAALALLAMLIAAMVDRRIYDRRDLARVVRSDVIVVVAKLAR